MLRVDCHTRGRDTVINRCGVDLCHETRCGDGYGRDSQILCGDARSRLFRGAESAATVAGNYGVNAHFPKLSLKFLLGLAGNARCRVYAGGPDFIQKNDFGRRIAFQNQPFDLRVRHRSHETSSHYGYCLSFQRVEPGSLFEHRNGRAADWGDYGVALFRCVGEYADFDTALVVTLRLESLCKRSVSASANQQTRCDDLPGSLFMFTFFISVFVWLFLLWYRKGMSRNGADDLHLL